MTNLLDKFKQEESANVAMLFALTFLSLIAFVGVAVDFSNANNARSSAQSYIDAAVLSGAKQLGKTPNDAEVEALVLANINGALASSKIRAQCNAPSILVDRESGSVDVNLNCVAPTPLSSIMGIENVPIEVHSQAKHSPQQLDIAMILDVSGSMRGDRLADLRESASLAANLLLTTDNLTRLSIVPYSHTINAGEYFEDLTGLDVDRTYPVEVLANGETCTDAADCEDKIAQHGLELASAPTSSTCMWERGGDEAFSDAPPEQDQYLSAGGPHWFTDASIAEKANALSGAISYSPSGQFDVADNTAFNERYNRCPSSPIMPLSDNLSDVEDHISDLQHAYGTNGALALATGWYTISENWQSVWPNGSKPAGNFEAFKSIILMTDGIFDDHRIDADEYGSPEEQTLILCDTIKSNGTTIYTISFQAPEDAQDLLSQCANSLEHSFIAENGDELNSAFESITGRILELALTQ